MEVYSLRFESKMEEGKCRGCLAFVRVSNAADPAYCEALGIDKYFAYRADGEYERLPDCPLRLVKPDPMKDAAGGMLETLKAFSRVRELWAAFDGEECQECHAGEMQALSLLEDRMDAAIAKAEGKELIKAPKERRTCAVCGNSDGVVRQVVTESCGVGESVTIIECEKCWKYRFKDPTAFEEGKGI